MFSRKGRADDNTLVSLALAPARHVPANGNKVHWRKENPERGLRENRQVTAHKKAYGDACQPTRNTTISKARTSQTAS